MNGSNGCYVYVLGSADGADARTYVGWTTDVAARLAAHNSGKGAKSTRGRAWRVLYVERYHTRGEAMSREWHLKRDRRFRRALLDGAIPG
ncbi:GIY-YIG nuclease family protein [Thalassospiraceae bacterium LMO-SO8]|nr:GIY-YIG nuclease family protein [Alphaproteobacteria bacterium LMO-S08]WND77285.1 GIY-YIG nuclease family protein [Thalassospiraceae bacterium LMO-SO8]